MKCLLRGLCALLLMTLLLPTALAAKATPTPPPVAISTEAPVQPPEQIQQVLDIAYNEWAELDGKTLKNVNKYTEWRGKGIGFGWCGGYITWCMMQANVEMEELEAVKKAAKESEDGVFVQVEGVHHVKDLGDGKYRITTLEGNMASRVKMYIHDYDMNAEVNTNKKTSTNLSEVPEDEREIPASDCVDYTVVTAKPSNSTSGKYAYYVNCFLMPYVPGEDAE